MTGEVTTRIEGARELDRVLAMLPREWRGKELEGALMTASNPLRNRFKAAAPRDPMSTRNAADAVTRRKDRKSDYSARISVGWFRRGFYLVFHEYGTESLPARPFARPVWDDEAPRVLDRLGDALGKRLERAAKRLAGPYQQSGLARRNRGRRRR